MSQLVRLEGKHSTQNAHCALVGSIITVHLDNVPFHIAWFTKQFVTLRTGDVLGFQMLPSKVAIAINFFDKFLITLTTRVESFNMCVLNMKIK